MSSKDAPVGTSRFRFSSYRLLSWCCGGLLLAAVFLASRWFNGSTVANAQAPRTTTAQKAPVKQAAPSTAAPTGKAVQRAAATAPAGPAAPAAKKPSALVNGEPIMPDQLANECLRRFGKEVLESIVNKKLIWEECQRQNIKITEKDVDEEIQRTAGKFGLTTERYLTMLREERDISPDQYRRDAIWPMLALRRLAANQAQVTEDEIKKEFESEYGPQVRVRMIAMLDQNTAAQVQKEAAAHPEKFGDLAKQHSKDPTSASSRGIIAPIRMHIGAPELEKAAFSLKKGEVSQVIAVANQFLVLLCEEQIEQRYISSQDMPRYEQRLHDQIRDNKLRAAASDLFKTLQDRAQVVNVLNDPKLSQQMPGVAATINGGQITMAQLADECILRHGKDVLEGEINRKLLEQELKRQNKQVTQPSIDEEIRRAAESYGFHHTNGAPNVEEWLKSVTETENMTVDLYVRDIVWPSVALKTIIGNNVQVTQEDLNKGFESNYGERVEVLAIVLGNQREASKVFEMARNNPTDQFFGELARQYSVESISRANNGKVPPIRKHGGQPVVEEEAFRLNPGEVSAIVGVGDKFIIMRCLGRTQPVVKEYAAVKDELFQDIHEKKLRLAMAQKFEELRDAAQIDNFLANTSQPGRNAADRMGAVSPAAARQPVGPMPIGKQPVGPQRSAAVPNLATPPAGPARAPATQPAGPARQAVSQPGATRR